MYARHTQATTTTVSPWAPWEKTSPSLQTIVTLHHTSISNLTRNLMYGAKQVLLQMIPHVTSSAEGLIQTQCQHYLTIKLQSRFSRLEDGNQITAHCDQTSFGFPRMRPIQTEVPIIHLKKANTLSLACFYFNNVQKQQDFISQVQGGVLLFSH